MTRQEFVRLTVERAGPRADRPSRPKQASDALLRNNGLTPKLAPAITVPTP